MTEGVCGHMFHLPPPHPSHLTFFTTLVYNRVIDKHDDKQANPL